MSQAERESLSALIDGELGRDEIRFMLRRADGSVALRAVWSRYHVIRAGIRHELPVLADAGFVEQVMRQLEGTSAQMPQRRGHGHHWLRWSAGGAIAAGVAAVALIMVQPQLRPTPVSTPGTARIVASRPATTRASRPMAAPTVPHWLSASPSAAQLAQPAAADFYSVGPVQMVRPHDYAQRLSPYMTLPNVRAPTTREARQVMYQLWSVAPPRGELQPVPQQVRAH